MRKATLSVAGVILAGILGLKMAQWLRPSLPATESAMPSVQDSSPQSQPATPLETPVVAPHDPRAAQPSDAPPDNATHQAAPSAAAESPPTPSPGSLDFNQAIDMLITPQLDFSRRQAAWQRLKETGQLDRAITELEQRGTANPWAPEYPAALGQAYLHKASAVQDIREQGILGMKADQTFDAALQLDPGNWDARFWKANAMTYWPAALGRQTDVVDQFVTLINQQEAQSPQSHFAQTYARLGDYYQKLGLADYAQETWERGATLFPGDPSLQVKLHGPDGPAQTP